MSEDDNLSDISRVTDYQTELDELIYDFDNFDKLEAEFRELLRNEQK